MVRRCTAAYLVDRPRRADGRRDCRAVHAHPRQRKARRARVSNHRQPRGDAARRGPRLGNDIDGHTGTMGAMTTTPLVVRDASQTAAYRIAAMLMSVGTLLFLAPKPFDTIVPAELPGGARVYTYASGVTEISIGALLLPRRTR